MYHEEKVIDGYLCWRDTPDGLWQAYGQQMLTIALMSHRAKIARLEPEAARYRWLRDNGHLDAWWSTQGSTDKGENIDVDIDTAMKEQEEL